MRRLPLVSPLERAVFLKSHPGFVGLATSSVAALASHTDERHFAAGETLHEAGEAPKAIYFLAHGSVRIHHASGAHTDLGAPGGTGLVELFAGSANPSRVTALEDTLVLGLDTREFKQILEDDFPLFSAFARGLGTALQEALDASGGAPHEEEGFPSDLATFTSLDLVHRLARARRAPLFERANLTVLTELLRFQEPRLFAPDEVLWKQGDPVASLAIVLDGRFELERDGRKTQLPAGAAPGAWEVFSRDPRAHTATAASASRLIEIDRQLFVDVLEDHFDYAIDYLGQLCRRLVDAREGPRREAEPRDG